MESTPGERVGWIRVAKPENLPNRLRSYQIASGRSNAKTTPFIAWILTLVKNREEFYKIFVNFVHEQGISSY